MSLCLTLFPADALINSLIDERNGVVVIRSGQRVERQQERLIPLRWVLGQCRLGVYKAFS